MSPVARSIMGTKKSSRRGHSNRGALRLKFKSMISNACRPLTRRRLPPGVAGSASPLPRCRPSLSSGRAFALSPSAPTGHLTRQERLSRRVNSNVPDTWLSTPYARAVEIVRLERARLGRVELTASARAFFGTIPPGSG